MESRSGRRLDVPLNSKHHTRAFIRLFVCGMGIFASTELEAAWESTPETQTAFFVVKTNLPRDVAQPLLLQVDDLLDETERHLRAIVDLSPRGAYKFRLLIFATMEEYQAYVSAIMTPSLRESYVEHSGGFFSAYRNEIALSCLRDCPSSLVHEFTHALAGRTFFIAGGERVNWTQVMPPWLNEGLAEYLSMRVRREETSHWRELKAALKDGSLMPLAELIDKQKRPLDHRLFYPCAWALVTFLIDRDPSGSPRQLKQYLQLLKTKRYATDQFETVFGERQNVEVAWKQFIESVVNDPDTRRRIAR